ncbi:MAG: peptidoglycan editing factor PgeF [Parasporobacterium sp.]|nr:peptidoglycan editing factor PgeF [Parasporobacterium sp.]
MAEKIIYTPKQNHETTIRKKERVTFVTFPALDSYSEKIVNAFSTRRGGFSKGIYKSMNLGLSNDDSKENILFNYMEFAKAIGINYNNIVISNQQHTTNIRIATEEDRGKGVVRERDYDAVDGFITNEPGVALCLLFADCVPVYLYDPEKEVIGLVHSGWKGTVGEISAKAIRLMGQNYGSRPEDIVVCIGPSICQDCYEVTADLYEAFSKVYPTDELGLIFADGKDTEHYQLDLWKAIELTLLRSGVLNTNIHVTDLCTNHNPDLLFSHRFTKGKRGNLAAVLMLKPEPPEDPQLFKNLLPDFLTK